MQANRIRHKYIPYQYEYNSEQRTQSADRDD